MFTTSPFPRECHASDSPNKPVPHTIKSWSNLVMEMMYFVPRPQKFNKLPPLPLAATLKDRILLLEEVTSSHAIAWSGHTVARFGLPGENTLALSLPPTNTKVVK